MRAYQNQAGGSMQTEKVGQRIKTFMARKEIDVTELARQTDLSADFLQSVIDDNVYPSCFCLLLVHYLTSMGTKVPAARLFWNMDGPLCVPRLLVLERY